MTGSPDVPAPQSSGGKPQLVWDLPLRLSHWALVLGVAGCFASHYAGPAAFRWHRASGSAVLVVAAFRVGWGLIGTRHARFASFLRSPRVALAALASLRPSRYRPSAGHTPQAGWMVLVLLALVLAQGLTGLFANDEIMNCGPLAGLVQHATSNRLSAWHGIVSKLIIAAIATHVAAAGYYARVLGDNLVAPMVSGFKAGLPPGSGIEAQQLGRAAWLLAALAALLCATLWLAPAPPELMC